MTDKTSDTPASETSPVKSLGPFADLVAAATLYRDLLRLSQLLGKRPEAVYEELCLTASSPEDAQKLVSEELETQSETAAKPFLR